MTPSPCQYCGRLNDAGAQFCSDCGKPLTKAAAARAAVAAGGGGGIVSRTSGPEGGAPGSANLDAPCPLCGSIPARGSGGGLSPKKKPPVPATATGGRKKTSAVVCRLDTPNEVDYYRHGGILHFVLRQLAGG
mgnify:CR=1 FL=1